MKSKITSNIYYFLFLLYFGLKFFKSDIYLSIISISLPFREAYIFNVFNFVIIYFIPILFGMIFSYKNNKNVLDLFSFGITIGLLNYFSLIRNVLVNNSSLNIYLYYDILLFPILFLFGTFLNKGLDIDNIFFSNNIEVKNNIFDYIFPLLSGLLVFIVNYFTFDKTKYLIGADAYYHVALSNKISSIYSIISSPYFFEGKNFYYSFVYHIAKYSSTLFRIDILHSWIFLTALFSFIFIYTYYCFAKKVTKSSLTAVFSTLLIISYDQILWPDFSLRIFGISFLLLFLFYFYSYLLNRNFLNMILSIVFFVFTLITHPEIAIIAVLIIVIYFFLKITFIQSKIPLKYFENYINKKHINNKLSFNFNIILFLILISFLISKLTNIVDPKNLKIFNEIPLSLFYPIGAVSFIAYFLFPLGLIYILNKYKKPENLLLLSIFSLNFFSAFYFFHIWSLYHRYFVEIGYISICLFAGITIKYFLNNYFLKKKVIFFSFFLLVLYFSFYPKYIFISSYISSTIKQIESIKGDLISIKLNTRANSVIITNPEDIINRYIPYYTSRYIFSGDNYISKDHQWQVLPFCNGPYKKDCDTRKDIINSIFHNPSQEDLLNIKNSYKIDYLMIKKSDVEKKYVNTSKLANLKSFDSKNYLLYDLSVIR